MGEIARFTLVDNRVCWRCGARAGNCAHIEREDAVIEMQPPANRQGAKLLPWSQWEMDRLRELWAHGYTSFQIADLLNRSRSSVTGMVSRLGIQKTAAA